VATRVSVFVFVSLAVLEGVVVLTVTVSITVLRWFGRRMGVGVERLDLAVLLIVLVLFVLLVLLVLLVLFLVWGF
jgi:hypothetical protein